MSDQTKNRKRASSNAHSSEEEELRKRRIRREIVRVEEDDEDDELEEDIDDEIEDDAEDDEQTQIDDNDEEEDNADDDGDDESDEESEEEVQPSKSIWRHIVTGGFITSDGATQYYRYLVAIAIMCFISIFLTFMSLNADSEYRRKERYVSVLRERSVLKSEERYRASSRDEVVRRLAEEHGVVMVDQNNSQRIR
ncbi:MAG: hypothetical protein E7135_06995 [Rikenellaceae bacterium]|nr:hypothetical protein [Rikenellaceae bacterium]